MMVQMLWYTDEEAREAMGLIGLKEVEVGRWVSPDGLKEMADFDGGVVMITRLWLDKPEFDVRTVHMGQIRDAAFLNSCLIEHIDAIKAKTENILKNGKAALKRDPSS